MESAGALPLDQLPALLITITSALRNQDVSLYGDGGWLDPLAFGAVRGSGSYPSAMARVGRYQLISRS